MAVNEAWQHRATLGVELDCTVCGLRCARPWPNVGERAPVTSTAPFATGSPPQPSMTARCDEER